MITINANKILIPVDFSETSMRAIRHGVAIAKKFGSEIILLHVIKRTNLVDIFIPALHMKDNSIIESFLEGKLDELATQIQEEHKIVVTPLVTFGIITSEICNVAEKNKVGLIVMGTQGADSENDMFLGSNSYRVLTRSEIPVMTVREDLVNTSYSNILLPVDSSEHSRQKVNSAVKIADKFTSRLHVLGLLGKHEDNYEYKLKVIIPQIKKLATEKHVVCTSEIDKATNRAQKTLEYANKIGADLIIIMSDEKAGPGGFILGTYAHQLINHSNVPVLTIPPELHPDNLEEIVVGGMWAR